MGNAKHFVACLADFGFEPTFRMTALRDEQVAATGRGCVKTENRKVLKGRFTIADTRQSRCRPFSQARLDSVRMKRTF